MTQALGFLESRLNSLELRVGQIERRLRAADIGATEPPVAVVPIDPPPPHNVVEPPVAVASIEPPSPPQAVEPPAVVNLAPLTSHLPPPLPPRVVHPIETLHLAYRPPPPPKPRVIEGELERTIGLRWAGWIGAVVLVIGAAFGVKYVYDQNWFRTVPPQVWLGMIFMAGVALIVAGEYVFRHIHRTPAASLFGAGVATLFLAGYVGYSYYNLYTPSTALVLMTVSAIIGSFVAVRANLVSIAVLSQLGGNIAPLLAGDNHAPRQALLTYLLALQVVALFLAWWGKTPKWWTLRTLSLVTTALWMVGLCADPNAHVATLMAFSLAYAALYHGELILSASRSRALAVGAGFAILVTGALTAVVLWATQDYGAHQRGEILLGMGAFIGSLGWALWLTKRPGLIELGVAHRIAAMGLLALAVPIALADTSIDIGWAILALTMAVGGAMLRSALGRWSAVAFWGLAVVHVVIDGALGMRLAGHRPDVCWTVLGVGLSLPTLLAFVLGIGGQCIAILTRVRDGENASLHRLAVLVSGTASVLWLLVSLFTLPALSATLMLTSYAWLLLAVTSIGIDVSLSTQAIALLAIAGGKWMVFDTLHDRFSGDWDALRYTPVMNPMAGVGVLLAGSLSILGWRAKQSRDRQWASAIAWLLVVWTGTFEIDRYVEQLSAHGSLNWPIWQAKQLAWTTGWTIALLIPYVWICLRKWESSFVSVIIPSVIIPGAIGLMALKYLSLDTTVFRLQDRPASVPLIANLQAATAAVIFASLLSLLLFPAPGTEPRARSLRTLLCALVGLWAITIEIDRHFCSGAFVSLAEQVTLSITWSIYAVTAVALGFRVRMASLRYFGLCLFAITLLKVVVIDLNQVQTGFRILSFMGLGGLLMGTSILYGKLGSRLLKS